jgi:hypothetical protein
MEILAHGSLINKQIDRLARLGGISTKHAFTRKDTRIHTMTRPKVNPRICALIAVLLAATMLLTASACPTERIRPTFTGSGIMRDTIFSVEERGLGAVMVWVTHSDREGYCFTSNELADHARTLIREHNGEVLIGFRAAGVLDSLNPCAHTEGDPQYTVYLGESLTAVPSR